MNVCFQTIVLLWNPSHYCGDIVKENDHHHNWIPKVDASDLEFLPFTFRLAKKKCQNQTNIMQKYFNDLSGSWGFNGESNR